MTCSECETPKRGAMIRVDDNGCCIKCKKHFPSGIPNREHKTMLTIKVILPNETEYTLLPGDAVDIKYGGEKFKVNFDREIVSTLVKVPIDTVKIPEKIDAKAGRL